ncbi:MAG: hypothetical protein R3F60_25050 [bacterium]
MTAPFVHRYAHREAARRTFGELADAYARFYRVADPVGDAAAAWVAETPGGRAALRSALARGPRPGDPPPWRPW